MVLATIKPRDGHFAPHRFIPLPELGIAFGEHDEILPLCDPPLAADPARMRHGAMFVSRIMGVSRYPREQQAVTETVAVATLPCPA